MTQDTRQEKAGWSTLISESVPLPGSVSGRRLIRLDLGLKPNQFTVEARTAGQSWGSDMGVKGDGKGLILINQEKFASYASARALNLVNKANSSLWDPSASLNIPMTEKEQAVNILSDQISTSSLIPLKQRNWAGEEVIVQAAPLQPPTPEIMIVEIYGVSSFMGNYGLGRTIRTFTLLPGEETKISLKTWRSSEATMRDASSIIDSQSQSALERFGNKVQRETSAKSSSSKKENWHIEANASASWGFGKASAKGGSSGEYQSAREEFAKRTSEATSEHAREASAKRDTSVTSSSEQTVKSGDETLTERTIRNVNMRRTLNFVFRELNQEYKTILHLKDIRVAFTNGNSGSYDEVAMSGLRQLLDRYVSPSKVETVAKSILRVVGTVFDNSDQPQQSLERVVMTNDGTAWTKETALTVNGEYDVPPSDGLWFYRFKRGSIGQIGAAQQVEGVVLKSDTVVMRTDSVIIEALLGQVDALDDYAMIAQKASADSKELANKREKTAQDLLSGIGDYEKRAQAFAAMFNAPRCCDEDER